MQRSPEAEKSKPRPPAPPAADSAGPEGFYNDQAFYDAWEKLDPIGLRKMFAEMDADMAALNGSLAEALAPSATVPAAGAASGEQPSSTRVKVDVAVAVAEAQVINLKNQRASKVAGDLVTIPDEWRQRLASQGSGSGSSPTLWDVVGSQSVTSDSLRYFGIGPDDYASIGLHWLGEQVVNVPKALAGAPGFIRDAAAEFPGAIPLATKALGDIFFGDGIERAVESNRQGVMLAAQRREQMRVDGDFYGLFSEYANGALALGSAGWVVGGRLNALSKAPPYSLLRPAFLSPEGFADLPKTGTINPSTLRFSQDSIGDSFRAPYGSVDDFSKGLKNGSIDPAKVEPIRIVEKDGKIFTLDNRRLYAFQQAQMDIPYVKIDTLPKRQLFKFTTKNDGVSIELRKADK